MDLIYLIISNPQLIDLFWWLQRTTV